MGDRGVVAVFDDGATNVILVDKFDNIVLFDSEGEARWALKQQELGRPDSPAGVVAGDVERWRFVRVVELEQGARRAYRKAMRDARDGVE